ncbi:DUF2157 domain-containing protein [Niabella defluvii]|nr:DUF2157 domain-containing protein [Niabella sp. I65]
MEALILITTGLVFLPKLNTDTRSIILTGAAALVGVLFAVFGQVYQTGANAYDFFLAWVIFISLWVWVSNFAALWLLYLLLVNTTIVLYAEQVAQNWQGIFVLTLLFVVDAMCCWFFYCYPDIKRDCMRPAGF